MRKVTLCFLIDGDNICIAMKKRGFGVGKWNGVGGKVREGETLEEAAIRELEEEIGIKTESAHLNEVGNIKFHFVEKPDWNQHMYIFFVENWSGEPTESEEMSPKWHNKYELPYDDMWVDDIHWLPKVLEGKKIEGEFHFINNGADVQKFEIREI